MFFEFAKAGSLVLLLGCSSVPMESGSSDMTLISNLCQEGMSRTGFTNLTAMGDMPCPVGTQVCVAGQWVGPMLYDFCENNSVKSCDGTSHGSVVTGYQSPTASAGAPCIMVSRTCLNGQWVGPHVFPSCSELSQ